MKTDFTVEETLLLVNFFLQYNWVVLKNKKTDAICCKEKDEEWNELTEEYNLQRGYLNHPQKILKMKYEVGTENVTKKVSIKNYEKDKKRGGRNAVMAPDSDYEDKLLPILSLNLEVLPPINICDEANIDERGETEVNLILNQDQNLAIIAHSSNLLEVEDTSVHVNKNNEGLRNPVQSTKKWAILSNTKIKQPVKHHVTKLQSEKKQLNEKYYNLTDSRYKLIQLQCQLTKKDLELKELEIYYKRIDNDQKEAEHQKRMELLNLQIESYNNIL